MTGSDQHTCCTHVSYEENKCRVWVSNPQALTHFEAMTTLVWGLRRVGIVPGMTAQPLQCITRACGQVVAVAYDIAKVPTS